MNIGEIAERLIMAAEIEDRLPRVGPAHLKAQQLAYVHTEDDMRGWGKRAGERDHLRREDADRHATHRREFWERVSVTARNVSEAEEAWGWLALVDVEHERSALAAWARCMADHKRLFFKDWCFENGIHPETGRRRKDRALARISAQLVRSDVQNSDNGSDGVLPGGPEIGDVPDSLAVLAKEASSIVSWAADDAFSSFLSEHDFSWSDKRNERRRQREAAKRKREAA